MSADYNAIVRYIDERISMRLLQYQWAAGAGPSAQNGPPSVYLGGGTDIYAVHVNRADEIYGVTLKATPDNDDVLLLEDSADAWHKKKAKVSAIRGGITSGNNTYTGAVGGEPGGALVGDLFIPNDGAVVERYTGSVWSPWGPIYPLVAPDPAAFSWVNQGTATLDTTHDGIILAEPTPGGRNGRLRVKSIPTAPYTLTVAFTVLVGLSPGDAVEAGLVLRDSASGNLVYFTEIYLSGAHWLGYYRQSDPSTFVSGTNLGSVAPAVGMSLLWLRIEDDGSSYRTCSYSLNGQTWFQATQQSRTDYITPDQIGFFVDANSCGQPVALHLLSWSET